jgi:hypothetical protein
VLLLSSPFSFTFLCKFVLCLSRIDFELWYVSVLWIWIVIAGGDITQMLIDASPVVPTKCISTNPREVFEYNASYVHVVSLHWR